MAGANDPAKDEGIWKWAQPVLTAVGSIAGLVIIVHLLGGIVMWLRFSKAGLPADQAIAVMTREQILAVGLRVMVLPALVSAGVAAALVWNDEQPKTLVLVLRIVAVAVAAILFLTLPVSWASVTWLALLLVFVYWWRGFGATRRRGRPSPWRLAAIAVLAAAIISLGRQIDEPVQLLQADVMLRPGAAARQVHGVFISQDVTTVYLGDVASGQIEELPRDEVASLDLGPPLARAPNRSLLSMVLGDHWSLTPLHWWCDGQSYTWFRLGRLCRTQPKARPDRRELDIRWIPVRVTCPRAAGDGCHGYLRTRTRETYSTALGPFAMSRRVSFPRDGLDGVEFSMSAGRARDLRADQSGGAIALAGTSGRTPTRHDTGAGRADRQQRPRGYVGDEPAADAARRRAVGSRCLDDQFQRLQHAAAAEVCHPGGAANGRRVGGRRARRAQRPRTPGRAREARAVARHHEPGIASLRQAEVRRARGRRHGAAPAVHTAARH